MGAKQWESPPAMRAGEETREAISDTRPPIGRLVRWVVGSLLVFHGLIHLLGPVEIWAIADVEELTGQPVIDLGQSVADVLAGAWLLALIVLVGAGIGVLVRRTWWRVWAVVGVVISQVVIFIWWDDAATGTLPNLIVIAAVVLSKRWGHDETSGDRAK